MDFSVSQFLVNLLILIQAPDVALYVGRDNGNYMNGTVDEVRVCSHLNLRITMIMLSTTTTTISFICMTITKYYSIAKAT